MFSYSLSILQDMQLPIGRKMIEGAKHERILCGNIFPCSYVWFAKMTTAASV